MWSLCMHLFVGVFVRLIANNTDQKQMLFRDPYERVEGTGPPEVLTLSLFLRQKRVLVSEKPKAKRGRIF